LRTDLSDDSVFAVKDKLIVNFNPLSKGYQPPAEYEGKIKYELEQNFWLAKATEKGDATVESSIGVAIATNGSK
jgi:catechol 1,2-dioxygenase